MALTGSGWTYTDTLTLTASTSTFFSSDVGNQIFLYDNAGDIVRFTIDAYTSATIVTGRPHKTVPATLQATNASSWAKAVDEITGLWHLEGKQVSVFADGFVAANPNNASYETVTVSEGKISLDKDYALVHVGLPITSDLETLDIESFQGETLSDKKKNVSRVTMFVESSRGIFSGTKPPVGSDNLEGLDELKIREDESYDSSVSLRTGVVDINIRPEWNSNGRVFIRQVDPLPLSVLSIVPTGQVVVR